MKIKLFILALLPAVLAGGCFYPYYLPKQKKMAENAYGSYLKLSLIKTKNVRGELIAIDSSNMILLTGDFKNSEKKIAVVPINKIKRFRVYYAKPSRYDIAGPILGLLTISHGVWSIFSLPVNVLASSAVTANAYFAYSDETFGLDDLRKYARFPQGLPTNVVLEEIK